MRLAVLIAATVLLSPALAVAHTKLVTANPAPGATVKAAPTRLRLTFNEYVVQRLATIAVTDPSGASLHVMPATADPKAPGTLAAVVHGAGKPGLYKVEWVAAGKDMHRVTGSYSFTVDP